MHEYLYSYAVHTQESRSTKLAASGIGKRCYEMQKTTTNESACALHDKVRREDYEAGNGRDRKMELESERERLRLKLRRGALTAEN